MTIFFFTVAVVTMISFLMAPVFQASSKIMIEKEVDPEKALLFKMNFPSARDQYQFINSEIDIIRSYPIAAEVIKKRGFNKNSLFIGAKIDFGGEVFQLSISADSHKKFQVS